MTEMYDDPDNVETTFNEENLSEYLIQAKWAEMVELKKSLHEIYLMKGRNLDLLDIGIGDGRVPKHLSKIDEIWETIRKYDAIDIAQNCVDLSTKLVEDKGIQDKVNVHLLDAVNLDVLPDHYDVIISTWFTVGNFYPDRFSFEELTLGFDLDNNEKFETIFRKAYTKLRTGGEIIIGSLFIDNEPTRRKQEEAYRNFGWTIITDERDSYTASEEGWWSQRFTRQRLYDYLSFVPREKISFIPLDTYDFSMMVRIRK
jgi:cyclopropane fatty-acyl-phospholipid synthase-like methyltransferase